MASATPSPAETKGPAIGIPAERLAVAVYAVGAQCHVAGHIIVRWYIFYVRGINFFQELSQSH